MMENGMQKHMPGYVLLIPGTNKGYQNNSGNVNKSSSPLLSMFSATSTKQCTLFCGYQLLGSLQPPYEVGTIIFILQIRK